MSRKSLGACLCAVLILAGCAEIDKLLYGSSTPAEPVARDAAGAVADAVHINPRAQAAGAGLRNVYIAPANLANMQVIQPEGAAADSEWWVTEEENDILQRAITHEFSVALGLHSAFNIVPVPAQADIVLYTAVVAVHPAETRGSAARQGHAGGAITVSIALVNAASEEVMLRIVDTRSGDDIWAFNQARKDDPALSAVFRAWGEAIRRGLLQSQGRPTA